MSPDNYWVISVLRGTFMALGPYRSEAARDNRYEKTTGGEVFKYDSWETDPVKVVDEFKAKYSELALRS